MCLKQPYTYIPVRSFGYNFTHGGKLHASVVLIIYTYSFLGCKKFTVPRVNFGSVKFLQSNQKQVFKCDALARCAKICVESVMTLRLFVVVQEKKKDRRKEKITERHIGLRV